MGPTLNNADGKTVYVQELCERDHLLVDYNRRFIPTLSDFVSAMGAIDHPGFERAIDALHAEVASGDDAISRLLLSPLAETGKLKSLVLTHNSWFINAILPRFFPIRPRLRDFALSPASFFSDMAFEGWMDNGRGLPASARRLMKLHHHTNVDEDIRP